VSAWAEAVRASSTPTSGTGTSTASASCVVARSVSAPGGCCPESAARQQRQILQTERDPASGFGGECAHRRHDGDLPAGEGSQHHRRGQHEG